MIGEKLRNILQETGPIDFNKLCKKLEIRNKEKAEFNRLLIDLEKAGEILQNKDLYYVIDGENILKGTFQGTTKGFGFLINENGDIFIPRDKTNHALDGDVVMVKVLDRSGQSPEGEVLKILENNNKTLVGTFQRSKNYGFVIPDNSKIPNDIFIVEKDRNSAKHGQKVLAKITKWDGTKNPQGKITEVLGFPEESGVDILSIAISMDLPMEFPKSVKKEVQLIPKEVTEKDLKGRLDLRSIVTFTIDGADSKDFDDAVSIDFDGEFYSLGVHIADVAHYVKDGSALDKEAYKRGNSYYLLTEVLPMLPKELSNGICSLNEGVDRLTLSCLMKVNKKGKVVEHNIVESAINSSRRLVYDNVSDFLEDGTVHESLADLTEDLTTMEDLAKILMKKRHDRGSIDFDFQETGFEIDKAGKVLDVFPKQRRIANKIIEEFMILANETVAEEYHWMEVPFIYRIHEEPEREKIVTLNNIIRHLGYRIKLSDDLRPSEIQSLIEEVRGKEEETFVNTFVLRSLQKAEYSDANLKHFGLASSFYTHFTSPIRRYSDLAIHRIIKKIKKGAFSKSVQSFYEGVVSDVATQTSRRERVADEAERTVEAIKMAQYMSGHIGEKFEGVISSITSFGFFVHLKNTIEGLVNYSTLDEYFEFNEDNYTAVGRDTGKVYSIGDSVIVEVVAVDLTKGKIDFKLG